MRIFIIILNWNGKGYIFDCLDSAFRLKRKNFDLEIVIVNNASTDGSDKLIENKYRDIKILRNKENLGFTGGNNVGISYSLENGADYVVLLNSDTILDENLVVQMIETADSNEDVGIVGPKIYFAPGFEYHKERYKTSQQGKVFWYAGGVIDWKNVLMSHRGVDEVDDGQYDIPLETDFVSGCCMLIKRKVLEKVGLLDDRYFLYLEDVDFCQRVRRAGLKVLYTPLAKLWHLNAGSSSVGGFLQDYFITRNRMLFGLRYAQARAKVALLKEGMKLLCSGRKWQRRGVRDFLLGKFGKGSWRVDK